MNKPFLQITLQALLGVLLFAIGSTAMAEPPLRAARLAYLAGTVSFSPAGDDQWVQARANRPLTSGDALWTEAGARAEVQVGGAAIRLGSATNISLTSLDDRMAQMQLLQGSLKLRVRSLRAGQVFEVDTPNLAFTVRKPGEYRIDVDPADGATAITVINGDAEVYGQGTAYAVNRTRGYRFFGTALSDYDTYTSRRDDELDQWARERDRIAERSASLRYVSPEVVGYEDLDANGIWRSDRTYGNVWVPSRVPAGWTPYRDGHWAWVDPWGWTWVDDAPWGYAVSHYGRWANMNGSWGWVPGPVREQAVYAPALVAFVGGMSSSVGWFPLAPREVYTPSYPVSRRYFDSVNRSNAVVTPAAMTTVYNTINVTNVNTTVVNKTVNVTKVVYVNQNVRGAVVAVPSQAFAQSQPVARHVVALSAQAASAAPVARVAAVAPVAQSLQGGAPNANARPPSRRHEVVARTAPPPPPVPFAAQQAQLAARPGAPMDDALRNQMRPAAPAAASAATAAAPAKVTVVTQAEPPKPAAVPPPTAPAPRTPEARRAEAGRPGGPGGPLPAVAAPAAPAPPVSRVDTAKAEADREEAAKADAAKANAGKADAARAEAAAKGDAARAESAKAAREQADARANAQRANADKANADKVNADKANAARADADKANAARAEAGRVAKAQADANANAERANADKARADKAGADKARADRANADKANADRANAARAEADRQRSEAGKQRAEAARAEQPAQRKPAAAPAQPAQPPKEARPARPEREPGVRPGEGERKAEAEKKAEKKAETDKKAEEERKR
jgi:hypothetical protein